MNYMTKSLYSPHTGTHVERRPDGMWWSVTIGSDGVRYQQQGPYKTRQAAVRREPITHKHTLWPRGYCQHCKRTAWRGRSWYCY